MHLLVLSQCPCLSYIVVGLPSAVLEVGLHERAVIWGRDDTVVVFGAATSIDADCHCSVIWVSKHSSPTGIPSGRVDFGAITMKPGWNKMWRYHRPYTDPPSSGIDSTTTPQSSIYSNVKLLLPPLSFTKVWSRSICYAWMGMEWFMSYRKWLFFSL